MRDLDTLPKAELHLHVEGTLEPELAFDLAARNGVELPFADVRELRAAYDFRDLQSFLDLYYATMAVLRTARDFTDLTLAYLERSVPQGLRHVELFFDPQAHTGRGVAFEDVVDGIGEGLRLGRERWGVTGGLIMCFLRDQPVEDAARTLQAAATRRGSLLGVGLDSAEVGHPPALFADVFAAARAQGLHVVAHAGEEAPPAYVREALDVLGVERVDHGVQAVHDADLLRRLAAEQVPLTVCPLSNVRLRVVDRLEEHPLHRLLAAGVRVTVNSDDPAYFGGYVGDCYRALREAVGLSDAQAAQLARNAVLGSFADQARKAELLAEVEAWVAG
ncbi:adenosine deaminase [Kineococcus glutinatus]|uniref:Adenine deaminase n=1 Tax=Kineococcus glutinatus TaxID=1070872 RepID=A0ABP9H6L1_9ACTN